MKDTLPQVFFDVYIPENEYERKLVNAIWFVKGTFPSVQRELLLPSGMAEIIFNLSAPASFCRNNDMLQGVLPRCFITGVNSYDITLIKDPGQYFVGIQFFPLGIKALLGIPANEVTNNLLDLTLISKEIDEIWHKLADEPFFHKQVPLLLKWLRKQVALQKYQADLNLMGHLFNFALLGNKSVGELRDSYNLSERTLRRKSIEWLGMSTESFLLYRKYLRSLDMLHNSPRPLTEIAYVCGYYDQPHFIREFKSYTSMTPGMYRTKKSENVGHIYELA